MLLYPALDQLEAGQHSGSNVPDTGWDLGFLGPSSTRSYVFDQPLAGDEYIAITLTWDRDVQITDLDDNYNKGDQFFVNELNDLNLWLVTADGTNLNLDSVARSTTFEDNVEHIFTNDYNGGDYKIVVEHAGGVDGGFGSDTYFGLSWRVGNDPLPIDADNDGDGDVDSDDLSIFEDSFGDSSNGDADHDRDTDGADFLAWQQNFTGPPSASVSLTEGVTAGGQEMYEIYLDIPAELEGTFDSFELSVTADGGSTFNQTGTPAAGVTQPSEDSGFAALLTTPAFFGGQELAAFGASATNDTTVYLEGTYTSFGSDDLSDQGNYLLAQIVMANVGGGGTYTFKYADNGVELGVVTGTFGSANLASVPEPTSLALLTISILGVVMLSRCRGDACCPQSIS